MSIPLYNGFVYTGFQVSIIIPIFWVVCLFICQGAQILELFLREQWSTRVNSLFFFRTVHTNLVKNIYQRDNKYHYSMYIMFMCTQMPLQKIYKVYKYRMRSKAAPFASQGDAIHETYCIIIKMSHNDYILVLLAVGS